MHKFICHQLLIITLNLRHLHVLFIICFWSIKKVNLFISYSQRLFLFSVKDFIFPFSFIGNWIESQINIIKCLYVFSIGFCHLLLSFLCYYDLLSNLFIFFLLNIYVYELIIDIHKVFLHPFELNAYIMI